MTHLILNNAAKIIIPTHLARSDSKLAFSCDSAEANKLENEMTIASKNQRKEKMGTDFALACGDCLEFIDTHKWSIIEEAGKCLTAAHSKSSRSLSLEQGQLQMKSNLMLFGN